MRRATGVSRCREKRISVGWRERYEKTHPALPLLESRVNTRRHHPRSRNDLAGEVAAERRVSTFVGEEAKRKRTGRKKE